MADALMVAVGIGVTAIAVWFGPSVAARGNAPRFAINLVLWIAIAVALVGAFDFFSGAPNSN